MNVNLTGEPLEATRCGIEETVAPMTASDPRALLRRLDVSTGRIRRFFAIATGVAVGWFSVKVWVTFDLALSNNFTIRFALLGLMFVGYAVIALAFWRLSIRQSQTDQEAALREMLLVAESDPHLLEGAEAELRRLSRRWSPTTRENQAIAREIVDRIGQARGSARGLLIAHGAPSDGADDLPRSA